MPTRIGGLVLLRGPGGTWGSLAEYECAADGALWILRRVLPSREIEEHLRLRFRRAGAGCSATVCGANGPEPYIGESVSVNQNIHQAFMWSEWTRTMHR